MSASKSPECERNVDYLSSQASRAGLNMARFVDDSCSYQLIGLIIRFS